MELTGFSELGEFLVGQPLLALAMVAILIGVLGGMLRRALPRLGAFLRGVSNLGLVAALLCQWAQKFPQMWAFKIPYAVGSGGAVISRIRDREVLSWAGVRGVLAAAD